MGNQSLNVIHYVPASGNITVFPTESINAFTMYKTFPTMEKNYFYMISMRLY